ncbi:lysozyme-like domain containing protein [Marinobacter sp.]|jgi:hypothetical protein|uniref:transglycosylase SLT domain-containing protein n=1 Tax=Marinobacter sp. TaxID=50741 RepID=UPI0025C6B6B7|nr:lysozyme-like domain containing protein [Marinobacter sp.]
MKRSRQQRLRELGRDALWLILPLAGLVLSIATTLRLGLLEPEPPRQPDNICEIFREHPVWYDYAAQSQERWGLPIATQMAFVYYESSFRSHARPPREKLLGFIPWNRPSTAQGYSQALDPAWSEYLAEVNDGPFVVRTDMEYALDFIGWYNLLSHKQLGIALTNPRHLYLAYHEGRAGYRRKTWAQKPIIQSLAGKIEARAWRYDHQLRQCEAEFRCRHFYQFPPFCE